MKRKIIGISIIVICLSLIIGGTLAYFTAEDTAENVITAGNIDIEIQQKDANGNDISYSEEVLPGKSVENVLTVKNICDYDCWVRVKITKEINLAEGIEATPDLSLIILSFNEEKWTEKDGYYYYNEVLSRNAETEELFSSISFGNNMGNIYMESTAVVKAHAEAVQAVHNGETVFDAAGWPED